MKKNLVILAIIVTMFIIGAFVYTRAGTKPQTNGSVESSSNSPEQGSQSPDQLTVEKDGIQVAVEEVKRENNRTIIKLAMDNHVYNLADFAVKDFSSLNGVQPDGYNIEGDQVGGPASPVAQQGGHHLEVSLVFPGELYGRLLVGLKSDLQFEFDIK
ncbi:MAG: hypothetical protein HY569_02290 [Candidatus Magasanikbacteria bacterium]|nr:hypothetical protein [Candidatus Magasanikbacteria bacterium]